MFFDIAKYILLGAQITIAVILIALPIGFLLGLSFSLLRVYGGRWISTIIASYSTIMRGIPPVVMLFVLYFVIAGTINISPLWAGAISLAIISSAYQLEIFRGALQSISGGQMMAAHAIGMHKRQAILHIILPQALRVAIPSWSNEVAIIIKDSSLVYALGVPEILRRAQFMSASTYQPFMAYGIAALFYFIMVFLAGRLLDLVEKRVNIPGAVMER
jgi:polar amino acid transport system permease protein